jgi:hypothetical protein
MSTGSSLRPTTAVPLSKGCRANGSDQYNWVARVDDWDAPLSMSGDSMTGTVRSLLVALGTAFHWYRCKGSDAGVGASCAHAFTKTAGISPEMDRPEAEATR